MSSENPPPHSCRHCQRVVLRRQDFALPDDLNTSREITLPHTAAEIRKALEDECVFFMCFFPCSNSFNHFDPTKDLTLSQRKSNLTRTVQAYRSKKALHSTVFLDPLKVKFCHGTFSIVLQRTVYNTHFVMRFLYEGHSTLNGGIQLRASLGAAADELDSTISNAHDPYVGSEESLRQAQKWLSTCHADHAQCSQAGDGFTPTRLLKIFHNSSRTVIRLVQPDRGTHIKWAALSYIWGGDQIFKSTIALQELFKNDLSVQSLPATIRDAVKVCEGLGLDYIWIDSFCIIQDDEQDLNRELAVMHKIYQQAWVTISASTANSVSEGFLQDKHPKSDDPNLKMPVALPYMAEDEVSGGTIILAEGRSIRDHLPSLPINQRAWTYQERRLSPRLLDFHGLSMSVICRTSHWSRAQWWIWDHAANEWHLGVRQNPPSNRNIPPCLPGQPLPTWHSVVEEYASREMTYSTDKLRAIAALADLYKQEKNHTYIAGLWKESLLEDLCWYTSREDYGNQFPQPLQRLPRPPQYRAPTWSWAAVDVHRGKYKINFLFDARQLRGLRARILDVAVNQLQHDTTYGQITSSYLDLEGDALEVSLNILGQVPPYPHKFTVFPDALEAIWEVHVPHTTVTLFAIHTLLHDTTDFYSTFGLILTAVSGDYYRRVGAFKLVGPKEARETSAVSDTGISFNGSTFQRQKVKIV